jgi:hypothetical protein
MGILLESFSERLEIVVANLKHTTLWLSYEKRGAGMECGIDFCPWYIANTCVVDNYLLFCFSASVMINQHQE